ncbi:MAG: metal-dependent hydrolase [Gemmataceae bacterium]
MASYRVHLMVSAPLGMAYGALVLTRPEFDWGLVILGTTLTTVGGLLPDLDSDSSVPSRETFGILSALTAVLLVRPILQMDFTVEQTLGLAILGYFVMRYAVSALFRYLTVHRGMFHSIPAALVSGLGIYLVYPSGDFRLKLYLAGGVTLGYLSHLILDEIYAVDFNGLAIRTNQFAGTALKFGSASWLATLFTYALLFGGGYLAFYDVPPKARNVGLWIASFWPAQSSREAPGNRPQGPVPMNVPVEGKREVPVSPQDNRPDWLRDPFNVTPWPPGQ